MVETYWSARCIPSSLCYFDDLEVEGVEVRGVEANVRIVAAQMDPFLDSPVKRVIVEPETTGEMVIEVLVSHDGEATAFTFTTEVVVVDSLTILCPGSEGGFEACRPSYSLPAGETWYFGFAASADGEEVSAVPELELSGWTWGQTRRSPGVHCDANAACSLVPDEDVTFSLTGRIGAFSTTWSATIDAI